MYAVYHHDKRLNTEVYVYIVPYYTTQGSDK